MKLRAVLAWIAGMAAVLAVVSVVGAAPDAAPQTLNVNIGGGQGTIAANDFFPDNVTIHAGDTIHFANSYPEPHTVSFLPSGTAFPDLVVPGPSGPPQFGINPTVSTPTYTGTTVTFDSTKYLNSGVLLKGGTVDVTFPKTGTYHFVCLIHGPSMSIDVTVVAASSPSDSQSVIDTRAANQLQLLVNQGQQVAATTKPSPATTTLPDGSTNWNTVVGATVAEDGVDQYFPPNLTVKAGDTVTWSNPTDVPHTVTFTSGAPLPPFITPVPQSGGAPFFEFTPQVFLPAGGSTYDGTGFVGSGFIQQGTPATTYSLKFTKPGTYTYVCALHADQGMTGTITVTGAAAGASTTPTTPTGVVAPNTGSGPPPVRGASWVPWLMLMATLGFAFTLVGLKARATRSR